MGKNYKGVYLLAAIPEKGNCITYKFNTFHLKFSPANTKYGNVSIIGDKWVVSTMHSDLIKMSLNYRPSRSSHNFMAERERLYYDFLKTMYTGD